MVTFLRHTLLLMCLTNMSTCIQLWSNLFSPPYTLFCAIWGIEGVATAAGWSCPHTQTCSSWQIKINSVVFGSGSMFIIFHFAQRASQTSAAACHVKTLYQALTAPPMHTHALTHKRTHTTLSPLALLHMWGTYVVICLTTTLLSSTLCTPRGFFISSTSLISCQIDLILQSFPLIRLSSATCLLSHSTSAWKPSLPVRRSFCGLTHSEVCLRALAVRSQTWKLKVVLSYLGCGQSVRGQLPFLENTLTSKESSLHQWWWTWLKVEALLLCFKACCPSVPCLLLNTAYV